jgi:predicted RNase H-like HicB family nuclease
VVARFTDTSKVATMKISIQSEKEVDGRWIAEVPEIPGVLAYGSTEEEALLRAETLALRALADRLENSEQKASNLTIDLIPAR